MNLLAELSAMAANVLVASTWEALVLVGAVALVLRLVPRTTAALRYAIWAGVLATALVVPFLPVRRPMASVHAVHADIRWSYVLAGVWFALSLVRAVQMIVSAVRLRGLWRSAVAVEGPARWTSDGRRSAELCVSDEVSRPSVIGFFAPRILIPGWLFAKISEVELDHIVLHEMEHLRRGDDWVNLAQKIGLIVFPLSPALMFVERRLCLERELACDDGVLQATGAPKAYATCLVNLAGHHVSPTRIALALGAWERRSELARRVHAILRERGREMSPRLAHGLLGVVILGVLGGGAELARAPWMLSFAASAPVMASSSYPLPALGGAHAEMASFRREDAPHATLLKAAMPEPARPAMVKKHRVRRAAVTAASMVEKRPAASRLVLASASVDRADPATRMVSDTSVAPVVPPTPAQRFVLTVFRQSDGMSYHYSYAVPTPDGWIILQL